MLVQQVLTIYAVTPSDSVEVRAGTTGVNFVTAGTCAITTAAGDAVTIAGDVGSIVWTGPLSLIRTGGTATVAGVVGA